MLKFTFEGTNLSEVKDSIETFLSDLGGGASVVSIAGGAGKEKTKKDDKPKKLTLTDVQDALVKFQDAATDKKKGREIVKELLGRFSVKSSSELPEAEYEDFLKEVAELT